MSTPTEHWVPKVHPLDRGAGPDDPMTLHAVPAPGDPDLMLECLVQEFAGMGWDAEGLLELFRSPGYPVLHQLREHYGEDEVRRRIASLLAQYGVFRVRETLIDDSEPEEEEGPELIELNVSRVAGGPPRCG